LKSQYGREVVRESTYSLGTFDPARARTGKRWVEDYAAIQSIIEGRVHGNQIGYRESVTVDISFGFESKVLEIFGSKIEGGYNRKYELAVQFYPKPVSI